MFEQLHVKGQLISKGFFFNSLKKRTKHFALVGSFFGRIEDIKISFRAQLTFINTPSPFNEYFIISMYRFSAYYGGNQKILQYFPTLSQLQLSLSSSQGWNKLKLKTRLENLSRYSRKYYILQTLQCILFPKKDLRKTSFNT